MVPKDQLRHIRQAFKRTPLKEALILKEGPDEIVVLETSLPTIYVISQ